MSISFSTDITYKPLFRYVIFSPKHLDYQLGAYAVPSPFSPPLESYFS
jgi:hypothetical protein